ncbi:MAG TPA: biopolymer transporter ExbD [Myxococcales bacterium LLY-WYZ-16_1]|jgi:biopolymer transport protein ExbD|nr:biopolymer transporter ExbD [Myxococcales bacterium LLY-WYZ-16_1]
MTIKQPGKRPFAPWLKEHKAMKGGGKKLSGAADLLLTPLIDMFVILVVFLIMNFSATGELVSINKDIQLPKASVTAQLERAPIVQVSKLTVAIEGQRVGDSEDMLNDPDLRVPELTDKLQEMRKVDEMMHPGQPFKGQIIINADKEVDFKLVRKVMFAAAEAGYTNVNYAVLQTGDDTGGEVEG